jgi:hypothetical protein
MRYLWLTLMGTAGFNSLGFAETKSKKLDLGTPNQLNELWHDEDIYFVPKVAAEATPTWNGTAYHYETKACFQLSQNADRINANAVKCPKEVVDKARAPYSKISNFKTYEAEFIKCLKPVDKECLRPLISRTALLSFGFDGYQDRRDYIFSTWAKEDYERLYKLIKLGASDGETSKTFPANQKPDDFSHRGEFKLVDGSWLLVSYVAGD